MVLLYVFEQIEVKTRSHTNTHISYFQQCETLCKCWQEIMVFFFLDSITNRFDYGPAFYF